MPLISSLTWLDSFESENGLPRYDWNAIAGTRHNDYATGPACIRGATSCELPSTQTTGALSLALNNRVTRKLMAEANEDNRYEFLVVTTGDNGQALDCRHSELTLAVSYTYTLQN